MLNHHPLPQILQTDFSIFISSGVQISVASRHDGDWGDQLQLHRSEAISKVMENAKQEINQVDSEGFESKL